MSNDRSREDEWFLKNERELVEAARTARQKREAERREREAAEERARLKDLHFMKCPKCGHDLVAEDFSGIEIDRCSYCEGVYLDAGELEELYLKKAEERRSLFRKLLRL